MNTLIKVCCLGSLLDRSAQSKYAMSEKSLNKIGVKFSASKQARSQQAVQNLVEAAEKLVETGDASNLNARDLAKVSGYSLGSLVQRLGKVENVFLHAIAYGRERHLDSITTQMKSFAGKKTTFELSEFLVDTALHAMKNVVGPTVMRYYEGRALGRVSKLEDLHAYTDEAIPALMELVSMDTTGTFREMTPFEYKYVVRSIFHILERPFIELDPRAGTEEHRLLAIRQITVLLSK